jgi:uncharacterized membrane protein SpoIIM required for sporulation
MKQQDFELKYNDLWIRLEQAIEKHTIHEINDFPLDYRHICHHLAIAKHRRYSAYLIERLNQLVLKCHHLLYKHNPRFNYQLINFLVHGFPRALRNNSSFVWLSTALFLLPGLLMFSLCYLNADMIYSVMDAENVRQFENMYDPGSKVIGRERESDTDLLMFGFYIKHNISISFQIFSGGILFGLGTAFFLFYNGLILGATAGHIANLGFIDTFYPFVIGHGAFELTAIVLSGTAGLKIGFSLIDPGPYSRLVALQNASREAVKIIYGTTLMLVIAAFLEAFWSSSTELPIFIKYSVGAFFWFIVIIYCYFFGRNSANGS